MVGVENRGPVGYRRRRSEKKTGNVMEQCFILFFHSCLTTSGKKRHATPGNESKVQSGHRAWIHASMKRGTGTGGVDECRTGQTIRARQRHGVQSSIPWEGGTRVLGKSPKSSLGSVDGDDKSPQRPIGCSIMVIQGTNWVVMSKEVCQSAIGAL